MSTAAAKRAAYAWIVEAIDTYHRGALKICSSPETLAEVNRIRDAMEAAAAIEDGPGVAEHVGGDGGASEIVWTHDCVPMTQFGETVVGPECRKCGLMRPGLKATP